LCFELSALHGAGDATESTRDPRKCLRFFRRIVTITAEPSEMRSSIVPNRMTPLAHKYLQSLSTETGYSRQQISAARENYDVIKPARSQSTVRFLIMVTLVLVFTRSGAICGAGQAMKGKRGTPGRGCGITETVDQIMAHEPKKLRDEHEHEIGKSARHMEGESLAQENPLAPKHHNSPCLRLVLVGPGPCPPVLGANFRHFAW